MKDYNDGPFDQVFKAFQDHKQATDAVMVVGVSPRIRISGDLEDVDLPVVSEKDMADFFETLSPKHRENFELEKNADFSREFAGQRFRINISLQRGTPALYIRRIPTEIPSLNGRFKGDSGLIDNLLKKTHSFIIISGPSGAGKTTSLAVCVNHIKSALKRNIICIEDPIEYLHQAGSSVVVQREVGHDVNSFFEGIKQALRQSSDVLVVGEMRDAFSFDAALQAAETGRLVMTTVHAYSIQETVSRMVGLAQSPEDTIRRRIAESISAIISQRLVVVNGEKQLVYELLVADKAIRQLIRSGEQNRLGTNMNLQKQKTLSEKFQDLYDQKHITDKELHSQCSLQ